MKGDKPRIAIIGDFPIGKVSDNYTNVTSFYPSWLYSLYIALSKSDIFDIHWIVINKIVKKEEVISRGNQTFHLYPGTRQLVGLSTAYVRDRYTAACCLKRLQPDLVHAWGTERFYGLVTKDYKKGRTLLSVQGLLKAYLQRGELSSFLKLQSIYETQVLKSVDHITTESPWAKEQVLKQAPSANITLWDYAVEKSFFNIQRNPDDKPFCLLACTNSKIKNVSLAIEAFSSSELRHVSLYMAGINKESYPNLPNNIIPLGAVSREGMTNLLAKSWCLVHPSLADTGPTILKEARVAGVASIATNDCGAKQYIHHGESGYIISPNNKQELIDSIIKVTTSRNRAIKMGEYGQKYCRQALNEYTMFNNLKEIYYMLLA